jgi:hypothetical protein
MLQSSVDAHGRVDRDQPTMHIMCLVRKMSPFKGKEIVMNPILLTVWAVLVACFLALLVYRGQLARYEEEQLFLRDEVTEEQRKQESLVRRLQKIEAVVKVVGGAAGLATVCAVGTYVWDAWQRIPS